MSEFQPNKNQYDQEVMRAQEMATWLPDFLYMVDDEPHELPELTVQRLRRQFGDGDPIVHLEIVRDTLFGLDGPHQTNLFSYFCGFPDKVLDVIADEEATIEESVAALDALCSPPVSAETARAQKMGVRPVASVVWMGDDRSDIRDTVPAYQLRDFQIHIPEWMDDALCAQTDPEAFFPEKGGSTRNAKKVCTDCDVRADCLEYALKNNERFGIWGGLSERERRKLTTRQGRQVS